MLAALIFWMLCVSAAITHGHPEKTPDLCVSSPLVTPYFTPLLDTPRQARGCSTLSTNPNAPFFARLDQTDQSGADSQDRDVHIISLQTIGVNLLQPVKLNVVVVPHRLNASKSETLGQVTLVLNSDRPVKWLLRTTLDDDDDVYVTARPSIMVSEGSLVEGDFQMNVTRHRWPHKKALIRYVKKTFSQGIASYTEVKEANHLRLKVAAPSKSYAHCDVNSLEVSAVVTASLMVQLKTEGCFHEDYIGDNPMDVYVVELEGESKGRNKRVKAEALVPVAVQLLGEGTKPVPRNVTVVLKSHQPIRWQFGAERINGNIVVVSDNEDQVENSSADGLDTLEVRSKTLPDDTVALLLSVTSEYGRPVLYAKTTHASTLRLVVGSKNKHGLRHGPEQAVSRVLADISGEQHRQEVMQHQPNLPGAASTHDPLLDPIAQLKAAMTVHCGKTLIDITFPAPLVKSLGSPRLSLSDPTCRPVVNGTHVALASHITSCGSTGHSDGKFMLFSNHVNVNFEPNDSDDEDMQAGSGDRMEDGQVPIVCRYRPHFPGDKFLATDEGNSDDSTDSDTSQTSLYHLELYRDQQLTSRLDFKGRDGAEVELDDTLYVKAFLDGVVPVQVVTEECWVSATADHKLPGYATLIRNTCPADLSTKLTAGDDGPQLGSFSFQVNNEYRALSQLYLHCRLGLCTTDEHRSKGNLKMCVNPRQYCSGQSLRPYLDKTVSTAQQFSYRGPVKLVVKRRQLHTPPAKLPTAEVVSVTAANNGARIVYVGVTTEVTIGIALASFLIGVALTAVLWYIHSKTDPFRQRDKARSTTSVGGSTGAVVACNLSPHSGCSSANSTAAIAT